jgi:2-polyprenyl-6-methoxyphenol hydroxylase-like FAD-dependent oxidoreductase
VVVGGGIAGLTAAIVLRRAGWDVVVVESRDELAEVNTGFALWSFAVERLRGLGLGDGLERIGEPIDRLVHTSWRGRPLSDADLGELNARRGAAAVDVHRAGLQRLLAEALGMDAVRLAHRCVDVVGGKSPVAVLAGGERIAADLIVGADGVNSHVRRHVAGDVRLVRPDATAESLRSNHSSCLTAGTSA